MLRLRDSDLRHPLEEPLERDARFQARQLRTGTGVSTTSERQMIAQVRPVELELVRLLETAWITIRRPERQHGEGARGHLDSPDRGRAPGNSKTDFRWTLDSESLLDEIRDPVALGAKTLL
jgi:hypothetical protein